MCKLGYYSILQPFNVSTSFAAKSLTNFKTLGLLAIPFVKVSNDNSFRSFYHSNSNPIYRSYKIDKNSE